MIATIDKLIETGSQFTFENNSKDKGRYRYTAKKKPYLSWLMRVEDFIIKNYGYNSSPYNLSKDFDKDILEGYSRWDFDNNHAIIMSALQCCKNVQSINTSKSNHVEPRDSKIKENMLHLA